MKLRILGKKIKEKRRKRSTIDLSVNSDNESFSQLISVDAPAAPVTRT